MTIHRNESIAIDLIYRRKYRSIVKVLLNKFLKGF